jgi:hypothetical protein
MKGKRMMFRIILTAGLTCLILNSCATPGHEPPPPAQPPPKVVTPPVPISPPPRVVTPPPLVETPFAKEMGFCLKYGDDTMKQIQTAINGNRTDLLKTPLFQGDQNSHVEYCKQNCWGPDKHSVCDQLTTDRAKKLIRPPMTPSNRMGPVPVKR